MELTEKEKQEQKLERIKEESKNYLFKDTWYRDIQPVLTNFTFILAAIVSILTLLIDFKSGTYFTGVLILTSVLVLGNLTSMIFDKKRGIISQLISLVSYSGLLVLILFYLINIKIALFSLIALVFIILALAMQIVTTIHSLTRDKDNSEGSYIHIGNFAEAYKKFGRGLYYWWFRHHKIAEFIRYFMVGNIVTVIQFIILPVLQLIFKNTNLINTDFRFLGPIGAADKIITLENGLKVFDPYYVFNFTAGPIGSSIERTLNGISGQYLSRGGLAYFLAMFITLVIAQILTFIMQRKVAFKSNSNLLKAIIWFVIATIIITLGQNALYGLYQPWLYGTFGDAIGGIAASFVQALISFWVFYPIFKIIFKKEE